MTHQQDSSEQLARNVLEDSYMAIASHIRIPNQRDIALVVFNSMNWKRSETITKEVPLVGDPFAFDARPYAKLKLVDSEAHSVPFEITRKQSWIIGAITIRFRAQDVPALGWSTYYLCPAEKDEAKTFPPANPAMGDVSVENDSYRLRFVQRAGSFQISRKDSAETVIVRYYHQPQEASKVPGIDQLFAKSQDFAAPVLPNWTKISLGTNLIGPFVEAEGEVQGATLKINFQLGSNSPVEITENVHWPGGKVVKLVRETEFPEGGKFVYGVPYGIQAFDNVMPESGPPEQLSPFDQVNREQWYRNREMNGWIAWRGNGKEITVASEARGGTFDGRAFRVALVLSNGGPQLPDMGSHPVPNEFATRALVRIGPVTESSAILGWEFYNPLATMISVDKPSGDLPAVFTGCKDGDGVILTTLKKAEDGKGWIARGYALEQGGEFPNVLPEKKWDLQPVNLVEVDQSGSKGDSHMRAFQIRSLRMEQAGR